jgi:hypothetical protein
LLGSGNALYSCSSALLNETVRAKELSNKLTEAEVDRNNLVIKLIKDKDAPGAKIFEQVFPCCKSQIFLVWPPTEVVKDKERHKEDEFG